MLTKLKNVPFISKTIHLFIKHFKFSLDYYYGKKFAHPYSFICEHFESFVPIIILKNV